MNRRTALAATLLLALPGGVRAQDPSIRSARPESVSLEPAALAVAVLLEGANLATLTGASVVDGSGRPVAGVTARLAAAGRDPNVRTVEVSASGDAVSGDEIVLVVQFTDGSRRVVTLETPVRIDVTATGPEVRAADPAAVVLDPDRPTARVVLEGAALDRLKEVAVRGPTLDAVPVTARLEPGRLDRRELVLELDTRSGVEGSISATLIATGDAGEVELPAAVEVRGPRPRLAAFDLGAARVSAGDPVEATLTLDLVPADPVAVELVSSHGAVTVPATVEFDPGRTSVRVTIETSPVGQDTPVEVSASLDEERLDGS